VIGIQEVRAFATQLEPELSTPRSWHTHFSAARAGYSGVAFIAARAGSCRDQSGDKRFDAEGRVLIAHFGRLVIANAYFPKGSGERDNSRVPYKLEFCPALFLIVT
jgi:exodeoxyribonuclease-3